MREAIAEYLEREEKRAAFIKPRPRRPGEHYQATGEHVTARGQEWTPGRISG